MDLNQIQQLKKENEDYLNTSRKAKQYAGMGASMSATPTNRRSSVATVQPVFDGMRASMAPTTPSNNYIQF